jgi:cytochrome c
VKAPWLLVSLFCALGVHAQAHAQPASELLRNQQLFQLKCASCHSIGCNRRGPKLDGLIGRRAGSVADFKDFTPALKESGIVWSEKEIDDFLRDPERKIPGTSMSWPGPTQSAKERQRIIAHIRRGDRSTDLCW